MRIDGALRVAGPDRVAVTQVLARRSTVIGLRFQAGVAARWLRLPMSQLLNARVDLEDLWGAEARRLGNWVGDGHDMAQVAERLQRGWPNG